MTTQLADGLARAIAVRQAQQQARANLYALQSEEPKDPEQPTGDSGEEQAPSDVEEERVQVVRSQVTLQQALQKGTLPRVFPSPTLVLAKPTDPMFAAIGPEGEIRMYKDRRPKSPRSEDGSTPDRSSSVVALPLIDGSSIRAEITPFQQQQIINTALEIQRNISEKSRVELEVQKSQIWTNRMNTGFTVLGVVVFALGVVFGVRKETHS